MVVWSVVSELERSCSSRVSIVVIESEQYSSSSSIFPKTT